MILVYSVAFAIAAAVSAVMTRIARDVAHRYDHLDRPDDRKQHSRAVPRVGGVGIATGTAAGLVALIVGAHMENVPLPLAGLVPVVVGASVVFALGLWDDLVKVGFRVRLAVQVVVAWAMTLAGWHIDLSNVPFVELLGAFEQAAISVPLTVLWTVGLINALNLLDGLDALAGGTALIGFTALAVAFAPVADPVLLAMCVLGAAGTAGFLVHNRHPATVFMGDGGSTLLGFLLAMAAVRGVSAMPTAGLVVLPVVALGLPILDTLTTMARRVAVGYSPFLPDADHLHHRAYARSGNVRVAVRKLHLTAAVFGALAVGLRVAMGTEVVQVLILLVTAVFAYAVVRRLGYVRTRDVMRAVVKSLGYLRARRLARRARSAAPPPDGATARPTAGDGHSGRVPRLTSEADTA